MTAPRDQLEIHLLGGFAVSYAGEPLPPLPSRTARLLFAWLVLNAGRPQPRSTLTDRLWPDVPESRARRRLSQALWQVQDSLGERAPDRPYVLTPGDAVTFDAGAPYWLDVEEFEARLDTVDLAGDVDAAGMRNLRRCVELYHGDLLAGSYEPWVVEEQERLRQRYVTALGRLVDGCKRRGSFEEALQYARRLTHQAPLREDAHREVMRLHVLLGQPSQALEQFERCRSVLEEELGTVPSAATLELCERIAHTRDVAPSRRPEGDQLVSRRLVGRDDERIALVDQLERTLAGAAGTVFVEGEPGIGKTQLLAQAAEDARWRGFTVLWGATAGPDVPYAAIAEALEPELGPIRVAQLRGHVDPVWLQVAGQLLPALVGERGGARPAVPQALQGAQGAERMREALVRVITAIATIDPLLLVVEDAHRADTETLELLRALGRRPGAGRLLVVVSFRDVEARAEDELWAELRAVDRDARPARLTLAPLSPFETAALLREVLGTREVPAPFVERVHREGGGNPLYVLELLRAMRDTGVLGPEERDRLDTLTVPVTGGLRDVIGDRLGSLTPAARDLVRLAAVLGTEFDLGTLEAAGRDEPAGLTGALGELVRRNVLEMDDTRCRFTHAATRRVVLDALGDDAARTLHGVAGAALEATHPARAEALAAHFRQAGLPDRALPHLRRAADRALGLHAYATAATHLATAVRVGDEVGLPDDERFDLLAELEHVLGVLGRRGEQGRTLDELAALASEDRARAVEARLRRATWLGHTDRFAEAVDAARAAAEDAPGPALRARALTALGRVLTWSGSMEDAVGALRQATTILADDPTAVEARFSLGAALRMLQRFDEAQEELERALAVAEAADDRAGMAEALGALADVHAETARTDEAVALYGRAVDLSRGIGYRHREGVALVNLGTVRLSRGEPVPALEAYDAAESVFASLGNRRGVATVQVNRAWLRHRWLGDDVAAEQDAQAALRYFEEVDNPQPASVCMETLAGVSRRRGRIDEAAEQLAEGLAMARTAGDQRAEVQMLRGRAELALATGSPEEVAAVVVPALDLVRRLGLVEFAAGLLAAQGLAAVATGDLDRAWEAVEEAVEALPASDEPHLVHHRVAEVAEATGRDSVAREHRMAAYDLLRTALAGLDERSRSEAVEAVPEHRAVVEHGYAVSPRTLTQRMAHRQAPRGRALDRDETVAVTLEVGPPPTTPEERREQLLQVIDQVDRQDAQATVEDLAAALEVSPSTIRRDLRHLRGTGHDVATRGSATA